MTKTIKILFLGFILLGVNSLFAQTDFRIVEINNSNLEGKVQVKLEILDGSQPNKDDFQVFGNAGESEPLEFEFGLAEKTDTKEENTEDSEPSSGGRNILFLIENSEYTSGTNLHSLKNAIRTVLKTLKADDKVNIASYGPQLKGNKALEKISLEFTSSFDILSDEINKITTPNMPNDTSDTVHTFKGIHEAIGYVGEQNKGEKILIVISRGTNNSSSPIKSDDCKERASSYGVKVYTVLFKSIGGEDDYFVTLSEATGGNARNAKSTSDMQNIMTDFLAETSNENSPAEGESPLYTITFDMQRSEDKNVTTQNFEIRYGEDSLQDSYTIGEVPSSFLGKYGIFIILILVVLVALVVWQMMEAKRKRQAMEEEEELEAERLAQIEAERESQMKDQAEKAKSLEEQNIMLQEQLRNMKDEISEVKEKAENPVVQDNTPKKFDMKQTRIAGGSAAPTLMVATNTGQENHVLNKLKMTIGRNPDNDIQIPEKTVSGNHSTITIEGGSFYLTDLNSTNGTFINGSRITKKMLKSGDMIKMGAANCKFQI